MAELPLFPLHVVLFPGMMLPLHIFEERYKQMISRCLTEQTPFGVVLIKSGAEVGEPAAPYAVGTTAHILEHERHADGCMDLIALGRQRFRLQRILVHEPYLVGDVEFYPLRGGDVRELRERASLVHRLLKIYMQLLTKTTGIELHLESLPPNPAALAILAAIILQVSLHEKQELLETISYGKLLLQEESLLQREKAILAFILETGSPERESDPFAPHVWPN